MTNQWSDMEGLAFLCRHLVALCISYDRVGEPSSEPELFVAAGTVLSVNDRFHFLTAGHILEDLTKALDSGVVAINSCVIADTFGSEAVTEVPIPFDFVAAPKLYLYEDGLDFGLIGLASYYVRLLEANGIKAIFRENWETQDQVQFDGYAMLGLPEEFTSSIFSVTSNGEPVIRATMEPTVVSLNRLSEPPRETATTTYKRFVGKIASNLGINSIVGMSGGPIFGFSQAKDSQPGRYWIVAIQSSWLPTTRTTFGCPIPTLAGLVQKFFDAASPAPDDEE